MSSEPLAKGYEPREVEKRWYEFWEREKLFAAREQPSERNYSIVIPPPNVTGVLHMGHALNNTLQDILCRYRRSRGDNVLWMPGTDHAGIATQNVVEKKLAAEGLSRHDVGRKAFIDEVWKWRREYGGAIINQLKRLGASCDWDRERFTMDEGLSQAVRKVFVQLYDEGLIYRGNYIINWCHRCYTALSDLEVEHEEIEGHLYHIHYPYADGSGRITVATTRPETMLGDTAVAVHPDDERYRGLSTQAVVLPLMEREIPIIRDGYVDMAFGSGALKVTPAHDPNDFEIGRRHDLPALKVIADDGRMSAEAGKFAGMDRFECRRAVVEALRSEGLLEKIEPLRHNVGHCYRCKEVVEPNLSRQWFVRTQPLAAEAIAAVEQNRTRIVPEMWTKTYYDWMLNIRDWCISRQIWWGHQIPAWTCQECGELMVRLEAPADCPACGSSELVQETDVLDTWFSSALWPFSTMGWPQDTRLLQTFYPTAVLVTGFDILFFWVARMMMMGIHFMKDVPFRDVYVHALVRDEDGKKMSKSKGNVIDPLVVIEKYGTDAFRFTLAAFAAQGRDVKMSERRVEGYRHFVNKLWNAARFALMNLPAEPVQAAAVPPEDASLPDRWILSRLAAVTSETAAALEGYRFNDAAAALYNFVWHEFCDWYLEALKPTLYDPSQEDRRRASQAVLLRVLNQTLILLHPFMPFVTEEIWHKLPGASGSIMTAAHPLENRCEPQRDPEVERTWDLLAGIVAAIRNIRGEMNVPPARELTVEVQAAEAPVRETVAASRKLIVNLARVDELRINPPGTRPQGSATAIAGGASIFVELAGIVDFSKESARLEKEMAKIDKELRGLGAKLENSGFLAKAPAAVVEGVRTKHTAMQEKRTKIEFNLKRLQSLGER